MKQIWGWYLDVAEGRQYSRLTEPVKMPDDSLGWQVKSRALPLTSTEISHWCQLNGVRFDGWQLAAIHLMDEIHVRRINDPPAPTPPPTAKPADAGDKSGWLAMFTAMGLRKEKS